jgi:hypothetical protein
MLQNTYISKYSDIYIQIRYLIQFFTRKKNTLFKIYLQTTTTYFMIKY